MTWWEALILGVVEGITEYLPVSSTGHLILTSALLGLDRDPEVKRAVDAYNIVIQGGAILAVLGLYRRRVASMIAGLAGRDPAGRRLAVNLIVAFLPAAVFGVMLEERIERHLFRPVPVIGALAAGGLLLIVLTPWQRRFFHDEGPGPGSDAGQERHDGAGGPGRTFIDIDHLTWARALIIGLLQCVAMWPGTSRSMMTIVGGMLVGMRPRHAAEFSFLLALPTLGGACVYTALDLDRAAIELLGVTPALIGLAAATLSAALAVRWLVGYLSTHGVAIFGWYRLILCAVLVVMMVVWGVPRIGG